jgi:hypothetical protein
VGGEGKKHLLRLVENVYIFYIPWPVCIPGAGKAGMGEAVSMFHAHLLFVGIAW